MFWKRGKLTKKTSEYEAYQQEIRDEMLGIEWPFSNEQVRFHVEAGLSAKQADLDNVLKPLLDTFQGIYEEFNDNKVYYIEAHKEIVPKGDEYLWIRIRRYYPCVLQSASQSIEESSKDNRVRGEFREEMPQGLLTGGIIDAAFQPFKERPRGLLDPEFQPFKKKSGGITDLAKIRKDFK